MTELHLDSDAEPAKVGKLVRRVLSAPGPLRLGVAYVSGNLAGVLGLPRSRWRDISLVCDPFGGSCDPGLLKRLHEAGARIACKAKLHAKVFISRTGAVVGSANISEPALDLGNTEAACFVSDASAVDVATSWFDALFASATPLSALLGAPLVWGRIEAAWQARMRAARPQGPHLRDALHIKGTRLLEHCIFSLWSISEPHDRHSSAAAKSAGLTLPEDWQCETVPFKSLAQVRRIQKASAGKAILYFRVRDGLDSAVPRFMSLDPDAWKAERTVAYKKEVYTFLQNIQSPVRLAGNEANVLVKELNDGLRRHPGVAKGLDSGEFVSPRVLAELLS